jgi:dipeptidase D
MSEAVAGLKPERLWHYFAEISRIPRGSKNETAVARYVLETAARLKLKAEQDAAENVVIRKPASTGRARSRSLCLQGHLDMVCEKNAGVVHDFLKDPIELVRKGNLLMAKGTTLGADNGVAVATCLAIAEDRSLEHGPLELLFTVDEETGLTGAGRLQPGFVESRTLMNLDSEEEGALYVGCSGGRDTTGTWEVPFEPAPAQTVRLRVSVRGLKGGHSGLEIDKGRGNAIKILARTVARLMDLGARVSSLQGGNKRNAIPREAEAVLFVPKQRLAEAQAVVKELDDTVRAELRSVEPDLAVVGEVAKGAAKGKVVPKAQATRIIKTLLGLPHGVVKMSADIPGLVETSTNVAVITTGRGKIELATSQRSSVASEILEIEGAVRAVLELGGAKVARGAGYPGWAPNLNSEILGIAKSTYQSLFGKEPEIKAIHAGLECGIIGEKYPGMDMVSFGPTLEGVHSPAERIHIDTVERFWDYVLAILRSFR